MKHRPRPSIPVKRFGQIVKEAEQAYKREDWLTIGRLNQELNAINTGMWFQNGEGYLWALRNGEPLPFDDILAEIGRTGYPMSSEDDMIIGANTDDTFPR